MNIYKITNKVNGKLYIGITTLPINKRFSTHITNMRIGIKTRLYSAMKSYGEDNFSIELIETTDTKDEAMLLETKYIKSFDTYYKNGKGYNMTYGGDGQFGIKLTEDHKSKISRALKGKPKSEIHKRNIGLSNSIAQKGKQLSEETKQKMSESRSGDGNAMFGKTGKQHPLYGTCWIYNDTLKQNKKIKKEDLSKYLSEGWVRGRKGRKNSF